MLRKQTLKSILVISIIIYAILLFQVSYGLAQSSDGGDNGGGCCCGSFCFAGFFLSTLFIVIAAILVPIVILIFVIIALVYVAKDSKNRGMDSPVLWVLLVIFLGLIGLIIYFIVRPGGALKNCRHCGGLMLETAVVCPHCNTTLTH